MRSFLTVDKLKEMLGSDWKENTGTRKNGKNGKNEKKKGSRRIDRFEMRNLRVVHFLLKDWLDRGYNSGSGVDTLAKNLGEFLRCRRVQIPNVFLERGRI